MSAWLAPAGASYVGSARLESGDEFGPGLAELLADTRDVELREQLRDICERPRYRIDLFRRGRVVLDDDTRRSFLLDLELVDLGDGERRTGRQLLHGTTGPGDVAALLRSAMGGGIAHPASIMPSDAAAARAARLDERFTRMGAGIRVDGTIGSALAGDIR